MQLREVVVLSLLAALAGCKRRQEQPALTSASPEPSSSKPVASAAPSAPVKPTRPRSGGPVAAKVLAFGVSGEYGCALIETKQVFCWEGPDSSEYVAGLPPADAIGVGDHFGCARAVADASLYCWGIDHMGQRGTGAIDLDSSAAPRTPGRVVDAKGAPLVVADFFLGGAHACALSKTGEVSCWGSSIMGESGARPGHDARGNWISVKTPTVVFRGATRIYGGQMTSCAVNASEELFCWGDQDGGYNGFGATHVPKRIAVPGPVRAMAFGSGHSCLLTDGPGVYCRGWNPGGQLGSAGTKQAPLDGRGARNSDFRAAFTKVPELSKSYAGVAASRDETCGVLHDGTVECLGTAEWPSAPEVADVAQPALQLSDVAVLKNEMGSRCALTRRGGLSCMGKLSGVPSPHGTFPRLCGIELPP